MLSVFQPTLDILGMVIYGTELVLWLGVFACGGYFNFAPWVRRKRSDRTGAGSRRSAGDVAASVSVSNAGSSGQQPTSQDRSNPNDLAEAVAEPCDAVLASGALYRTPSSTSAFRTASASLNEDGLEGMEMGSSYEIGGRR